MSEDLKDALDKQETKQKSFVIVINDKGEIGVGNLQGLNPDEVNGVIIRLYKLVVGR